MKEWKLLAVYDKAKRTQLPENWNAYWVMRNTVNALLDTAHKDYCANLFKESFTNNKEQFWSYIKRLWKDHSGVLSLIVNGKTSSSAKDKILNKQFQSVFIKENLYWIFQSYLLQFSLKCPEFHFLLMGFNYFKTSFKKT